MSDPYIKSGLHLNGTAPEHAASVYKVSAWHISEPLSEGPDYMMQIRMNVGLALILWWGQGVLGLPVGHQAMLTVPTVE